MSYVELMGGALAGSIMTFLCVVLGFYDEDHEAFSIFLIILFVEVVTLLIEFVIQGFGGMT
jgi:hypothetical protein